MTSILIRSVSDSDLEALREEAAERGESLQAFMLDLVRERASARRNRQTLRRVARRLAESEPSRYSVSDLLAAKDAPRKDPT